MLKKIKDFTREDWSSYCTEHNCNSCIFKFRTGDCLAMVADWMHDSHIDPEEEVEVSTGVKLIQVLLPLKKAREVYGEDKKISEIMDTIEAIDENVDHVEYNIMQLMFYIYVRDVYKQVEDFEDDIEEIPGIGDEL